MDSGGLDETPTAPHVVAVPFPGRGHVNPMLVLARLLAARGIFVTVVVTEEWFGLLSSSAATWALPPNMRFRTIPNVLPSEHVRAANFSAFVEAVATRMQGPLESLLDEGVEPPAVTAILADTFLGWAVAVGEKRGVPVCSLWTMPASMFAVHYQIEEIFGADRQLPVDSPEVDERLHQHIPGFTSLSPRDLTFLLTSGKPLQLSLEAFSNVRKARCVLFTSFYELEPEVIDALRKKLSCPVYTVGPSIPYMSLEEKLPTKSIQEDDIMHHFNWLDSQTVNSVLYLSLGSFLSVSGAQMDEIATGLRASGVRFLWVARGDTSRWQEMAGGGGLVVPWCDQLRVLCHASVGGFLTHCGWNSTLEALYAGVTILTFPIFADQPMNSRLITSEWKVGLSVKEEAVGGGDLIEGKAIASIVKRLMDVDASESREMRRRALELREIARGAVEAGGSSFNNLDAFKDIIQETK